MLCVQECGAEEVLGSKKAEVTGGWRKLHDEELLVKYLCCQIKGGEMVRAWGEEKCV
jgi:hypothetical protein